MGRASALAEPGDYVTCELADQPIIVLRDQKNAIRAFSNVCRHRMSTLLEGAVRLKVLSALTMPGPIILMVLSEVRPQ